MRSLRENVERNLAPVFAWQVLRLVWNQIVANSGSGQPTHLIIDEAWYLLEQPGAAIRLERMTIACGRLLLPSSRQRRRRIRS
jgi:hypothetical protein